MDFDISQVQHSSGSIASLTPLTSDRIDEQLIEPSNLSKFESKNVWDHPSKLAIVITGCDSGFGKIAAELLPRVGYVVIATCLTHKSVKYFEDLYKQLYDTSGGHHKIFSKSLRMDVTDDESVESAIRDTRDYLNVLGIPGLYALINNAGIWACSYLRESSNSYIQRVQERASFRKIIETNLFGSYNATLSFIPLLESFTAKTHDYKSIYQTLSSVVSPFLDTGGFEDSSSQSSESDDESVSEDLSAHIPCVKSQKLAQNSTLRCLINKRRRARVIFISSVLDSMALPGQAAYCASKYAIKGLHESIHYELNMNNISSVIISPAIMKDTNLFNQLNVESERIASSNFFSNLNISSIDKLKKNMAFMKRFGGKKEDLLKILLTALAERVPNNEYRNTPGSLPFKLLTNSWSVFKDLAIYIGLYVFPPVALFCLDLYHRSFKPFSSAFNFSFEN